MNNNYQNPAQRLLAWSVIVTLVLLSNAANAQSTEYNYTGVIQTYTVPAGVTKLTIEALGAQGGNNGGKGAHMKGVFNVTPGQQFRILVGQRGFTTFAGNWNVHMGSGGGGGTFVTTLDNTPLIVAGGGGGNVGVPNQFMDAVTTTSGQRGFSMVLDYGLYGMGGVNGNGSQNAPTGMPHAGNGGGFFTPGQAGYCGQPGAGFLQGGAGGVGCNGPTSSGGFGGGGGGGNAGGGGGGGYSGGGGSFHFPGNGGGGGSFNGGSDQVNLAAANTGHGKVIISIVNATYYADADGDGYGDPSVSQNATSQPAGYVAIAGDCDDTSATINPAATEVCDGIDNDCDGLADEGVIKTFYADADSDGYGDPETALQACESPAGYVLTSGDCDDNDDTTYPGAAELCDGKDHNCDGVIMTAPTFTVAITDVRCAGESNGTITIAATGGNAPYEYSLNDAAFVSNSVFTLLAAGIYHVKVRGSDGCEATQQTVTVGTVPDITPPTISCPAPVKVTAAPGECGAIVNYLAPTTITFSQQFTNGQASPHCDAWKTFTDQLAPDLKYTKLTIKGSLDPVGVSITDPAKVRQIANALRAGTTTSTFDNGRTWAVGACGIDNQGRPAFELTANSTICNCNSGYTVRPCIDVNVRNPNWGGAGTATCVGPTQTLTVVFEIGGGGPNMDAADNCGPVTLKQTAGLASGSVFPVGVTTNTFEVSDAAGNKTTCSFTVTVEDKTSPTAVTKPLTVELDATGNVTIEADDVNNGSNDACGIKSLSLDKSTFDCSNVGTNTVTLTVIDEHDNSATATAVVTVKDITSPVVLVKSITVELDANGQATIDASMIDDGSHDACGIKLLELNRTSFSCNELGEQSVTLTVTDNHGNFSSADAIVMVVDEIAPTLVTRDIVIQLNGDGLVSVEAEELIVDQGDNCAISSVSLSKTSFTCDDVGMNTVEVTVVDVAGNTTQATAQVTVEDLTDPVAVGKSVTVFLNENGEVTLDPSDVDGGSTDACGVQGLTVSQVHFDCSMLGENSVTLTVTDFHGNQSSIDVVVTVVDSRVPVIVSLPRDMTVSNDRGRCGALVSWDLPSVTDNCSAILSSDVISGSYFNLGTTTVTYIAKDKSGNISTASFTVTVTDDEDPMIAGMPVDQTVMNDAGKCSAVISWNAPTATDNCAGVSIRQITGPQSGSAFPQGKTLVTYEATDAAGNVTKAFFSVTVNNVSPLITQVSTPVAPLSIGTAVNLSAKYNDNNIVSAVISWGDGTDSNANITTTGLSGTHLYASAGVFTIQVLVTDACDASHSVTQTQPVVIYDPYGGFVTGGGWFYSGAGAYKPNPTVTGKATFGFVSKYKKRSSVPDGNTEFQFHAAHFKFKSTSYEWLAVGGNTAIYKGVGEVNGKGGYGFLISAVDGGKKSRSTPDRIRVKIWNASGNVIYDNQRGAGDGAVASTQLGGGSIVIHDSDERIATNVRAEESAAATSKEMDTNIEIITTSAYPNPFQDVLTVTYLSDLSSDVTIDLLTPQGVRVYGKTHQHNPSGTYEVDLKETKLTSEVYILMVEQGKRKGILKVVRK